MKNERENYIEGFIDHNSLERESKELFDSMRSFTTTSHAKIRFIEDYIDQHAWIQLYCFDEGIDFDDEGEEGLHYFLSGKEFERMKNTIRRSGGTVAYLEKQFPIRARRFREKALKDLLDPERYLIEFLGELVKAIQTIKLDFDIKTSDSISGNDSVIIDSSYLLLQSWLGSNETLKKHMLKLREKNILSFDSIISAENRPSVTSETPSIDILCLFKFWEDNKCLHKAKHQYSRICKNFKLPDKEFDNQTLRNISDKTFSNPGQHERQTYMANLLKKL